MTAASRPGWRRRLNRTRRRATAAVGLVTLRTTFGVLQRVSPAAAERKAVDVWCTLPPGAAHRHDHRPGPGSVERVTVAGGRTIVVESWGAPDAPAVYLVHGWGGWRGHLGALVQPLVDEGFRPVAIDAPGHGDADDGMFGPRRGTVMEMIAALEAAVAAFGPAAGVVAHSLGTTVAARALRDGLAADRLVLLAPNPAFGDLVTQLARTLRLNARTTASLRRALEEITERPIDDFDLVPMGADGTLPATLVVHDRDDQEAPHAVGAALAATWPRTRLVTTEGLGHYRVLRSPEAVDAAVAHVVEGVRVAERA